MKSLPTILAALLMTASITHAATDVSGTITTQTWTAAGSPYVLTADVTVLPGETLTIEPGVDVNLSIGTLKVAGRINAQGTEADSIRLEGGRIEFQNAMPSVFRYVVQRGAITTSLPLGTSYFYGGGVSVSNSTLLMEHCVIERNAMNIGMAEQYSHAVYGGGIAVIGRSFVTMRETAVRYNLANSRQATGYGDSRVWLSTAYGGGVYVGSDASLLLDRSEIVDNYALGTCGGGIAVFGSLKAFNSLFARNSLENDSYQYGTTTSWIYHMRGSAIGTVLASSTATLTNCTLVSNTNIPTSHSGYRWVLYGAIHLTNSIVWGNSADMSVPSAYSSAVSARYSDVLGTTAVDLSGDGNIAADPLLADTAAHDYSLLAGSACIDAGDPGSPQDADGTRADMGVSTGAHVAGLLATGRSATLSATSNAVWVASHGIEAVTITGVDLPDGWTTTTTFPAMIAPGTSVGIAVSRSESSATEGTVTIHHDAADEELLTVAVTYEVESESVLPGLITTRTLTTDHSPYMLTNESEVPSGATLTIEAGVEIQMTVGASLTVLGEMIANGKSEAPVRFVEATQDGRGAINIRNGATAQLTHTVIRDGNISGGGALRITGSGTTVLLDSCNLVDNTAYQYHFTSQYINAYVGAGAALYIADGAAVTARYCKMQRNASGEDAGIYASNAELILDHCLITDNEQWTEHNLGIGPGWAIYLTANSTASANHCTIAGNQHHGSVSMGDYVVNAAFLKVGSITMENSVFGPYDYYDLGDGNTIVESYNYAFPWGELVPGEPPSTLDAIFVDAANGDYRLRTDSPCIDAGDPNSPKDPDGSRADIGAIPYGEAFPVAIEQTAQPVAFSLEQNAPNPFNPRTTLRFSTAEPGAVRLAIYDVNGRHVRALVNRHMAAGSHEVTWDGCDDAGRAVASGVFVYRLVTKDHAAVGRMTLVR